ncbi:MAG: hypothetical protein CMO55_14385 [Verrucomicrobiales bacterium]|nr:hypothetical protein [Verrucomicrobiales bacterium]
MGKTIYILGCGAVGFPLAVYLSKAGRNVVAVRTSARGSVPPTTDVTIHDPTGAVTAALPTINLNNLDRAEGLFIVSAKSYANPSIAEALVNHHCQGPVVLLQNGIDVESPFLRAGCRDLYRCVVYLTSQSKSETEFSFRSIAISPIGTVKGDAQTLEECVRELHTDSFPFRAEDNIDKAVWKKAICNVVFNSVCPLLEVDNSVFAKDKAAADIARNLVSECLTLTERLGIDLTQEEVLAQIMTISENSTQLISTLQDIRAGRKTEIDSLNIAMANLGATLDPPVALPQVELLGKMTLEKSALSMRQD